MTSQPRALINSRRSLPAARSVFALMLREMATSYGRSPGGYLWAILDPVLALALLSVLFSFLFGAPPLGSNFALFYATGYLPFMMYSDIAGKIGASVRYSRPLLAYPGVTFVDALVARLVLNALTHTVVLFIIVWGTIAFFGLNVNLDLPLMLESISMSISLAAGIGALNCYLSSTFPLWERIWSIANRPMFMISGVFFLFEGVPETWRDVLWYNPVIHPIEIMRAGVYATHDARYASPLYVYAVSLVTLFLGMVLLYRHHRNILNDSA